MFTHRPSASPRQTPGTAGLSDPPARSKTLAPVRLLRRQPVDQPLATNELERDRWLAFSTGENEDELAGSNWQSEKQARHYGTPKGENT